MDERVARIKTPEDCEQFIINVKERLPELAQEARRRAVELRAEKHGATSAAEREALEAVYAYEQVLSQRRGKKIRASRTWQMIKRYGIIPAIERVVGRDDDATGYVALAEMGMSDLAFESVVARHPNAFSEKAISRSTERLANWSAAT
ncbi:MAG: hypothetical protein H0T51_12160 [Pirellulales bacterium]|nr:hypothetical protein [Pirellulales bacterium]